MGADVPVFTPVAAEGALHAGQAPGREEEEAQIREPGGTHNRGLKTLGSSKTFFSSKKNHPQTLRKSKSYRNPFSVFPSPQQAKTVWPTPLHPGR